MPDTRFNDGKPDRQGRFWSGSMFEVPGKPIEFIGALYRMDPDLSGPQDDRRRRLLATASPSAPDSKTHVFLRQPLAAASDAYDFDPATGDIENRRTFIDMTVTGGGADGATVDAEGCYWVDDPGHQQGLPLRSRRAS